VSSGAFVRCHQFQSNFLTANTGVHAGKSGKGLFDWSGEGICFTAAKEAHEGVNRVFRFVNFNAEDSRLTFKPQFAHTAIYRSNVVEQPLQKLDETDGTVTIEVKPHEILTLLVVPE
jgi:alpha-mannosidase